MQEQVPASTSMAGNKRWYVVHAYSGYRKDPYRGALLERIERTGMKDFFGDILVPVEEVVEVMKGGQKSISERQVSFLVMCWLKWK